MYVFDVADLWRSVCFFTYDNGLTFLDVFCEWNVAQLMLFSTVHTVHNKSCKKVHDRFANQEKKLCRPSCLMRFKPVKAR
jgi:hypothetical protein